MVSWDRKHGPCLTQCRNPEVREFKSECFRVRFCIVYHIEPPITFMARLFHHTFPYQPSHPTARIEIRHRESLVLLDRNDRNLSPFDKPVLSQSKRLERTDDRLVNSNLKCNGRRASSERRTRSVE